MRDVSVDLPVESAPEADIALVGALRLDDWVETGASRMDVLFICVKASVRAPARDVVHVSSRLGDEGSGVWSSDVKDWLRALEIAANGR